MSAREATFDDYLRAAWQAQRDHPQRRVGQTYFNVLHQVRPDLAAQLRGTRLDPFNFNERITDFLEWTLNRWTDAP